MRHAKRRTRLNLTQAERKAFIMNQCCSILKYQRIITTYSKAKVVRSTVERILSLARDDTLGNRRKVFQVLNDHILVKRVFEKFGPLFKERNGGYTRLLRFKRRRGDNASLVIFELTNRLPEEKPVVKEKKEKKTPTAQQVVPAKEKPQEKEAIIKEKPKPKPEKAKPPLKIEERPKPPLREIPKEKKEKRRGRFLGGISKFFRRKQEL